MPDATPFDRAVDAIGTKQALADALGITAAAISQWGDKVPPARVLDVERLTGISRHELRPDIFGPAPAEPAAQPPAEAA